MKVWNLSRARTSQEREKKKKRLETCNLPTGKSGSKRRGITHSRTVLVVKLEERRDGTGGLKNVIIGVSQGMKVGRGEGCPRASNQGRISGSTKLLSLNETRVVTHKKKVQLSQDVKKNREKVVE